LETKPIRTTNTERQTADKDKSKDQIQTRIVSKGDLDNIILKALSERPGTHALHPVECSVSEDIRLTSQRLPDTAQSDTWNYRAENSSR
jgi:hypothetical protein